jgi:hypothetical protein
LNKYLKNELPNPLTINNNKSTKKIIVKDIELEDTIINKSNNNINNNNDNNSINIPPPPDFKLLNKESSKKDIKNLPPPQNNRGDLLSEIRKGTKLTFRE